MTERRRCGHQQQAKTNQNYLAPGSNSRGLFLGGLRNRRLLAALTQKELAERAGVHQSAISNLENCRRAAFSKTVRRLCVALEVSPVDLLTAEATEEEG